MKLGCWIYEHCDCMYCVTLEGKRDKEEPCDGRIPWRDTLWSIRHILKLFQRVPDLWRGMLEEELSHSLKRFRACLLLFGSILLTLTAVPSIPVALYLQGLLSLSSAYSCDQSQPEEYLIFSLCWTRLIKWIISVIPLNSIPLVFSPFDFVVINGDVRSKND